jgi:spermidine synthase
VVAQLVQWRRRLGAGALALALAIALGAACGHPAAAQRTAERDVLVHETRSEFSHIRIRDRGSRRTLYFVRDSGQEVVETSIDLKSPQLLQIQYTRLMFVSLLYRPEPEACLIVGLGGGAMVRFLNFFFPQVRVDVVEIDPAIVAIARQYFGTEPRAGTRILTADGLAYLRQTPDRYDLIYMDAFLKPGGDNDTTGVPLRLKTETFLKGLHQRLRPGGLVVFNINASEETAGDIATIRSAFPAVDVYRVSGTGTVVAVAALRDRMPGDAELRERARMLDRRGDLGFSFEQLLAHRGT